jgi:hypothetical protein
MKRLTVLRILTHVLYVLSKIAIFFVVPFVFVMAVMPERIPFKIDGQAASSYGVETIIYLLVSIVGLAFDIYALYSFKKLLRLFEKNVIFHLDVIKTLNQIGKAILIAYTLYFTSDLLYFNLVENTIDLEFVTDWESTMISFGLGLFFLVLGDVFLIAKDIKEENDLTV